MNPSDERWFVRVQDREYGPVDFETLREWRDEGRLIPDNDVRRTSSITWRKAGELAELFPDAAVVPTGSRDVIRRRTWGEIIRETFRIYFGGFVPLFAMSLLTAVPSFFVQTLVSFPFPPLDGSPVTLPTLSPAAIVALLATIALWPISTAGLQLVADTVAHRERVRWTELLRNAFRLWGRMLLLGLLVYGSYFFWTAVPFAAMLAMVARPSILSLLLILLIGGFTVYMNARLFINFLFWEQAGALGGKAGIEAIRESKDLARSRPNEPLMSRPLYRGATIASIWLLIALAVTVAAQVPFVAARFIGVNDPNQMMQMAQNFAQTPHNDALTIAANISAALFHALLRPLLAASFVVLYYDARVGRP